LNEIYQNQSNKIVPESPVHQAYSAAYHLISSVLLQTNHPMTLHWSRRLLVGVFWWSYQKIVSFFSMRSPYFKIAASK
jgi:hypothetical protein